MSTFYSL